jgi:hypothetical protein
MNAADDLSSRHLTKSRLSIWLMPELGNLKTFARVWEAIVLKLKDEIAINLLPVWGISYT